MYLSHYWRVRHNSFIHSFIHSLIIHKGFMIFSSVALTFTIIFLSHLTSYYLLSSLGLSLSYFLLLLFLSLLLANNISVSPNLSLFNNVPILYIFFLSHFTTLSILSIYIWVYISNSSSSLPCTYLFISLNVYLYISMWSSTSIIFYFSAESRQNPHEILLNLM